MDVPMDLVELVPAISYHNLIGSAINWILGLGTLLLFLIEFLPVIEARPISRILGWIGNVVNREVMKEVATLKKTVDDMADENSERYAISCRSRILQFGDELRQGIKHSKESFDQILEYVDTYEKYCCSHPEFKNNKTVLTTKKILEVYEHSMDVDDFL